MTVQIDTIDKVQIAQWGAAVNERFKCRECNRMLRSALRRARYYVELELTAHQKAEMLVPEELQSLLDEIDALI